jgi:hypothetical protein
VSGNLNETDIRELLMIVKPALESLKIDYWLGRGVLRQQYLTGSVGDKQSDLDIHIWAMDRSVVKDKFAPILASLGFNINDNEPYKLAFANDNNDWIIEFMLLFTDEDNSEVVYHTRRNGVHLECPKRCFETTSNKIEISGIEFNAPNHINEYLFGVYCTDIPTAH